MKLKEKDLNGGGLSPSERYKQNELNQKLQAVKTMQGNFNKFDQFNREGCLRTIDQAISEKEIFDLADKDGNVNNISNEDLGLGWGKRPFPPISLFPNPWVLHLGDDAFFKVSPEVVEMAGVDPQTNKNSVTEE